MMERVDRGKEGGEKWRMKKERVEREGMMR